MTKAAALLYEIVMHDAGEDDDLSSFSGIAPVVAVLVQGPFHSYSELARARAPRLVCQFRT